MNQLQVLLHTALIDSGHIEKCGLLIRDTSQIKTTSVGYKVEIKISTILWYFSFTVRTV